jgi:hypothetical protein
LALPPPLKSLPFGFGIRSYANSYLIFSLFRFRAMDLDGDGYLSMYELEYFYEEQLQRMEQLGIETLPFEDCLCQVIKKIIISNTLFIYSILRVVNSRIAILKNIPKYHNSVGLSKRHDTGIEYSGIALFWKH